MSSEWIEVAVWHVYPPNAGGVPTTPLVGPSELGNTSLLRIPVSRAEAMLINAVSQLQQSTRPPVFSLARRVAAAFGARVRAAYLKADGPAPMRGYLELWTWRGRTEVPISAG